MHLKAERGVALVLAASRGLGYASATELANRGTPVAICGRRSESVEAAAERLTEIGPACGYVADVSEPDQLRTLITRVTRDLGEIAVLVVNSGGPAAGNFDQLSDADWDAAYRVTIGCFVTAVSAVLPAMRRRGFGRIIVIGSSSVRRPISDLTLSNTFRPALNGLVKDLAIDTARDGVTVNLVAPGRIETERVGALDRSAAERRGVALTEIQTASRASIPIGRYGQPAEFAAVVGFLASPQAAYVTGQSILVDGGMTASMP